MIFSHRMIEAHASDRHACLESLLYLAQLHTLFLTHTLICTTQIIRVEFTDVQKMAAAAKAAMATADPT